MSYFIDYLETVPHVATPGVLDSHLTFWNSLVGYSSGMASENNGLLNLMRNLVSIPPLGTINAPPTEITIFSL